MHTSRWIRLLSVVVLLLLASGTSAADWLEPGAPLALDEDEGLLLLVIDSDAEIEDVVLDRDGSPMKLKVAKLSRGVHVRIAVASAGTYRFLHLGFDGRDISYKWKFPERLRRSGFTVEPGKINYFGDVVSRGAMMRDVTVDNRASTAVVRVEERFPGLVRRYPWRYAGPAPDPFVTKLLGDPWGNDLVGKPLKDPASAALAKPDARETELAPKLFQPSAVRSMAISPSGKHFVEHGEQFTKVVRISDLREHKLLGDSTEIEDLEWIDDHRLVVTREILGFRVSTLYTLPIGDEALKKEEIQIGGVVLSATANPGEVVFAATDAPPERGVFRVNVDRLVTRKPLKGAKRLRRSVEGAFMTDADGSLRIVRLAEKKEDRVVYRYLAPSGEEIEFSLSDDPDVDEYPIGFDAAGRLLLITNRDREQRDLVVFDPLTGRLTDTLFTEPGNDVIGLVRGNRRVPQGVVVLRQGRFVTVPLERADEATLAAIGKALPNRSLAVFGPGANGARLALAADARDPGSWYLFHPRDRRLELLARVAPDLDAASQATKRRLVTKAADGFEIESFLTIANEGGTDKKPLLVLNHGGPIGAFEADVFDAEAQYFAQLGWAVLQVNYRGSGNAPKSGQMPALGYVGQGIESDIDAAVDHALTVAPLDSTRIATGGTSYGGYAAVMLTLKRPDRYRAAFTVAGVSDLPLMFSAGDMAWRDSSMNHWTRLLGDPYRNEAQLVALSPVYRTGDLSQPILIVHDRNDKRVPFEHARRLQLGLERSGKPARFIAVDDREHGLVDTKTQHAVYPQIAAFLRSTVLKD